MTGRRTLVVANAADPDAGYVGDRLAQRGLPLGHVLRESHALPPEPPPGVAVLLLLGSDWSVATPQDADALEAECRLVRAAVAAGVPVLGLCYGAQVAAHAFGGRVTRAAAPEIGLVKVESSDELVPEGPWWAFHHDVISPPDGATLLARNGCGLQAFSLPGVLAVQFHPEVRPEVFLDWLDRSSSPPVSPEERRELAETARRLEPQSRAAAYALVDGFLERFGGGRGHDDVQPAV